jgi:cobalt/nickel transport system permease protein
MNNDGVSRLDARVKIALLFAALALILTHKGFVFPMFMMLLSFSICLFLNVPPRKALLRFSEPLFIAAVLFFIKSLSGSVLLHRLEFFGFGFSVYRDGAVEGLRLALRMLAAVGAVSAVGFSTPFSEFLAGLGWFRFPKLLIELSLFAFRYAKVFFEEAQVIYHSQRNRLGYSSLRRSLNSFGILAGSLTIRAFDQAQATSTAMGQRGYDGRSMRLSLSGKRPDAREFLGAGLFMALMVLAWKLP